MPPPSIEGRLRRDSDPQRNRDESDRQTKAELLAAVEDGRMTPRRAAIAAGYRKEKIDLPLEPEAAVRAIVKHFPEADGQRVLLRGLLRQILATGDREPSTDTISQPKKATRSRPSDEQWEAKQQAAAREDRSALAYRTIRALRDQNTLGLLSTACALALARDALDLSTPSSARRG
jgi:hypothetical protein